MKNIIKIMNNDNDDEFKSLVKYGKPSLFQQITKDNSNERKGTIAGENDDTKTEDILNSILPPREYTKDKKQLYVETVLTTPATRADVIQLEKDLGKQLKKRGAKEVGLCSIREDLYSQCFDELIRQITINCSHRGLLLVRVRDELRMNIQCYQNLYESAMAYGIRRTLASETYKQNLNNESMQIESEIEDLEKEIETLEKEIDSIEENDNNNLQKEQVSHLEDVANLCKKNQRLKEELEKKLTIVDA